MVADVVSTEAVAAASETLIEAVIATIVAVIEVVIEVVIVGFRVIVQIEIDKTTGIGIGTTGLADTGAAALHTDSMGALTDLWMEAGIGVRIEPIEAAAVTAMAVIGATETTVGAVEPVAIGSIASAVADQITIEADATDYENVCVCVCVCFLSIADIIIAI